MGYNNGRREDSNAKTRNYGNNERHTSSKQSSHYNSGYSDNRSDERNKKQIYEYDSAERVGNYVKIID